MSEEAEIVVEVERVRCGMHNSRLGAARITSGEPYVLAGFEGTDLPSLATELAETGHVFRVEIVERFVSMLEWYGCESEVG
ncbi:MAG TPA: hypothetical protein VMW52_04645 [Phycisphaerae bacterium]|nr:hypothetical protein [Polyangiales bacterium]HUX15737.1 hypothetical protein [Phycisphaerae bacterium]